MISFFALKLGFKICSTNTKAQKINNSILETFDIIITTFQIKNKIKKA